MVSEFRIDYIEKSRFTGDDGKPVSWVRLMLSSYEGEKGWRHQPDYTFREDPAVIMPDLSPGMVVQISFELRMKKDGNLQMRYLSIL